MEKRIWVKPAVSVVEFAANECVAACGTSGKTYKFTCDAGNASSYYAYNVYLNGEDGIAHTDDDILWAGSSRQYNYDVTYGGLDPNNSLHRDGGGLFNNCNTQHVVEHTDDFFKGYMYEWITLNMDSSNYGRNNTNKGPIDVIVWKGPNGNNTHCTEQLDITTWETGKS